MTVQKIQSQTKGKQKTKKTGISALKISVPYYTILLYLIYSNNNYIWLDLVCTILSSHLDKNCKLSPYI